MRPGVLGGSSPDLSFLLARFVAESAVDEAARARARQRALRSQASEDATFVGILLDLAERGRPVVAATGDGRRHRGLLRTVATDFCILRTHSGIDQLISYDALGSVRPLSSASTATGSREARLDLCLADALTYLVTDRHRVRIAMLGEPEPLVGELRAIGRDVLTVRLGGDPAPTAYVAVALIAELALSG